MAFLYSQDLSNCTTSQIGGDEGQDVFVLSRFK